MFNWVCPQCGHDVPPSKTECPHCAELAREAAAAGQPVAQGMPQAGAHPYAPETAYPGWQQPPAPQPPPPPPQQPAWNAPPSAPAQTWSGWQPGPQPPHAPPPPQWQPAPEPQYPPQQQWQQAPPPPEPPRPEPMRAEASHPPYPPPAPPPPFGQPQWGPPPGAPPGPPPPAGHRPPPPGAWAPPPPARAGLPTWALTVIFALAFLAIGAAVYFGIQRFSRTNPAERAGLQEPASGAAAKAANPLQKYVEVVGIRMFDEKNKPVVRFVVVNHSNTDISDLGANVTLWASTSRSEEDAVGTFSFKAGSLGPDESKELTEPLKTKLKIYELPDWQNATAEINITSPQP